MAGPWILSKIECFRDFLWNLYNVWWTTVPGSHHNCIKIENECSYVSQIALWCFRCVIWCMFTFVMTLFLLESWWRHQMETFSALLAICARNSPVLGEFPAQRPVTRSLVFSLICAWISGWVNNREAGYMRRYRVHYDVMVMVSNVTCHEAAIKIIRHQNVPCTYCHILFIIKPPVGLNLPRKHHFV